MLFSMMVSDLFYTFPRNLKGFYKKIYFTFNYVFVYVCVSACVMSMRVPVDAKRGHQIP